MAASAKEALSVVSRSTNHDNIPPANSAQFLNHSVNHCHPPTSSISAQPHRRFSCTIGLSAFPFQPSLPSLYVPLSCRPPAFPSLIVSTCSYSHWHRLPSRLLFRLLYIVHRLISNVELLYYCGASSGRVQAADTCRSCRHVF